MSTRRRRTRGPGRPMLARVAALMAGVLLVSGAAALTWWGERVPAAPDGGAGLAAELSKVYVDARLRGSGTAAALLTLMPASLDCPGPMGSTR